MNAYEEVIKTLFENTEGDFQKFSTKIINSQKALLGVRTPKMKEIAKSVKDKDDYIRHCEFKYYEDTFIYGLIIAQKSYDEFIPLLEIYLKHADSWAHIDSIVPMVKCVKKEREKLFEYVKANIDTAEGFTLRFLLTTLHYHYLTDRLDYIFEVCERLDKKGYYNDMAIAWTLSTAYIKFKEKTEAFLTKRSLSEETLKKTLRKIFDSFRVDENDKIRLRENLWN